MPDQSERFAAVDKMRREEDVAYLKQDAIALLSESHEGVERVTKIVQDLKDFSRIDFKEQWKGEDIHHGLDSTLNVIWNELKYSCEVHKEYGMLPPVECLLPQLNQVFMNLLVNAAQAIETKGTITIRTGSVGEQVWIEIADTGKGIPPENINSIFDPFFTTKPVGKGTGLGLSVSYSIIRKHHGRIEVDSTVGQGSTFRVWLPIIQPENDNDAGMMSG
jgi:signal transduction histidine kinase